MIYLKLATSGLMNFNYLQGQCSFCYLL